MSRIRTLRILMAAVMACSVVQPAGAATCTVPSTPHPTIQAAIDDLGCSEILVAGGTFAEAPVIGRALQLQGSGGDQTFIEGRVVVTAGVVQLTGLRIAAPGEALTAHSGAEVVGFDLVVLSGLDVSDVFADGFESGNSSAWSSTTP